VFVGPLRHAGQASFPDLGARELACLAPLAALVLLLGIWPGPLCALLDPWAAELAGQLRAAR
jgi:NADH:ubiquinone oxidoreductase subunit 4 (subunit M)